MLSDLTYASRSLLKSPGYTAVILITLALGIGATTAIFSVVSAVLLRPLAYAQPERLARLYTEFPKLSNGGIWNFWFSAPEYLELRREARSWESIDAWLGVGVNLGTTGQPIRVSGALVTGDLLSSLGVAPLRGRLITAQDDQPGAPLAVVISSGLWQRAFAGDPGVVGRQVLLEGGKATIVGIMPNRFEFPAGDPERPELWAPLQIDPANSRPWDTHYLAVLGRLKPGVTLPQARDEIRSLTQQWAHVRAGHNFDPEFHTIVVRGLQEDVVRNIRPALQMLMGAVCFLLLIAVVNVANLLLARAEARQHEVAVRSALGAGVWRLARQFAVEGLLLACVGAMLGLVLARLGLELIRVAGAESIPRAAEVTINAPVVLFSLGIAVLTGLIFGLTPLAHVKRDLQGTLKSAGASTSGRAQTQRFRQALVVAELAFALILLAGAGLMLRAFWKLQEVRTGVDSNQVTTMLIALSHASYPPDTQPGVWARLSERLGARFGDQNVSLSSALPPNVPPTYTGTEIEGQPYTDRNTVHFYHVVTAGYFKTLRISLREGRLIEARDAVTAPRVVVINETMARTFWGSESPVGHRIRPYFIQRDWFTVVGVVADVKNDGLDKPVDTEVYFPAAQLNPQAGQGSVGEYFLRAIDVAIRSPLAPGAVASAVRQEVNRIDPTLTVAKVSSLDEVISATQSRPRLLAWLLSLFSGVALVLAAVGIYGVISYSVAQRTREFGLRMALGARDADVLRLVFGSGIALLTIGVVAGLVGALALTRFLSGFLFGVTATDPETFVVVSATLATIALLACYVPARRATKVDPLIALRAE
jgi:putative ABC transport system permease protein